MFSDVLVHIFRLLPGRLREQLKARIGAAGHTASIVDTWRARRLTRTWKRPDVIIADVMEILDGIGWRSLNGKRVMDFGSGILPADAFGYAVFGAAEVHAVDYTPLYQDRPFREYVAQGDWRRFSSAIADRCGPQVAENWFRKLRDALADPGDNWKNHLGLRYVAPFDILKDKPPAASYDFIASRSTLEHVPVELAEAMMDRMAQLLAPEGAMHHHIHLADHRDIARNPYGFLAADDDYTPAQHDLRGNRLRASDWRKILGRLDFEWSENALIVGPGPVPEVLAPEFRGYDRDDLLVTVYIANGVSSANRGSMSNDRKSRLA